jgi:2'-hydroxyisoflavone reductase
MKILVLGGTSLVGRHIVEAALEGGHEVTLFNRGVTNPGLFPSCDNRIGDRTAGDLSALDKGEWDGVIDVNGYAPREVRQSTELLAGRVGHYTFISSLAVYAMPYPDTLEEASPLWPATEPEHQVWGDYQTYGPMKAACEQIVRERFGDRSAALRPSMIVGRYDPHYHFTYFVRRAARGGTMIGPGRPHQPIQLINARDLGDFSLLVTLAGTPGAFNAVGPSAPVTLADMLVACAEAAGVEPDLVWVDDTFLEAYDVRYPRPPHWPTAMGADSCMRASVGRAVAAGLRNRSLVETAADTLAWDRTRDWSVPMSGSQAPERGGMPTPEREREVLDAWRARLV